MNQQRYYLKRLELFNYMMDFKNLTQKLIDLDKKAQELDEVLRDMRVAANDVLWDFLELKSNKDKKKANKFFPPNLFYLVSLFLHRL